MNFADVGKTAKFNALPGGSCFVFAGYQIGFKVINPRNANETRAVSLSEGQAISSVDLGHTVLHLPNARIVPTVPLTFFPGTEFKSQPGAILLHESGTYLSFGNFGGPWLAKVDSGESQRTLEDEIFVYTKEWMIVTKLIDKDECIFTHQPTSSVRS